MKIIHDILYWYLPSLFWKYLGGRISICRNIIIHGFNAMHVSIQIRHKKYGWICFHPPLPLIIFGIGNKWPWYIYISPNATPWASTLLIGPRFSRKKKKEAKERKKLFGYVFDPNILFCPKCDEYHMKSYDDSGTAIFCSKCRRWFYIGDLK